MEINVTASGQCFVADGKPLKRSRDEKSRKQKKPWWIFLIVRDRDFGLVVVNENHFVDRGEQFQRILKKSYLLGVDL